MGRHPLELPCKGHCPLLRQLHGILDFVLSGCFMMRFLCFCIICCMLSAKLELSLIVFLLNILWSILDFGKIFAMRCRKILPVSLYTFVEWGG